MPNSGPMACPIDGTTLVMSERQGIEIDYCPSCRGVWLDRGELERLVDAESTYYERAAERPSPRTPEPEYHEPTLSEYFGGRGHHGHGKPHYKQKKRKSFLEELFD